MPRHHDDESPYYQLPPDPTGAPATHGRMIPGVPASPDPSLSGPSAQADVVAQPSAAVSTARHSSDSPPTTPTNVTQRDRAYTLYCQGLRSDTIATRLGVPPRTVRRWLHRSRQELILNARDKYISELLRAIEGQRAVIASAWSAYEREHRLEDEILAGRHDYLRRRTLHLAFDSPDDPSSLSSPRGGGAGGEVGQEVRVLHEEYDRPHRYNVGARYLAVIIAAQREVARLQGLYDEIANLPPPRSEIIITRRPDGPENIPPPRPGHVPYSYSQPYDDEEEDPDDPDDPGDPDDPDNDDQNDDLPDASRHH